MKTAAERMRKYRAKKGIGRAIQNATWYGITRQEAIDLVNRAYDQKQAMSHSRTYSIAEVSARGLLPQARSFDLGSYDQPSRAQVSVPANTDNLVISSPEIANHAIS